MLPSFQLSSRTRGILYVTAGALCLTISDSFAKWLGDSYWPPQILFLRAALAAVVLTVVLFPLGGRAVFHTRHLAIHGFRGLINVLTACSFYLGLGYLPLADAAAISFCAPLFVTILSVLVFKDVVSWRGWIAVVAGFIGVLVIARPSPAHIQWAALFPFASAFGYAVMMLTAKKIGARESMFTTMFYIAVGQAVFAALPLPWLWKPVEAAHWLPIAGIAVSSTLGLGLITQAFRTAPAVIVAPFDYTGLVWAALIGMIFWAEIPDAWSYLGAGLIAASGLLIVLKESQRG